MLLELRQDGNRLVDGNGKADVARTRADRGVDPHHLPGRVDQRTAAVAEVDRGIRLDVVVQTGIEQLPSDEAHHANRDGMHVPQRVSDRTDPLPDAQLIGIAKRRFREVPFRLDAQQRHVDRRIGTHHLPPERPAVRHRHGYPLRPFDDVMVGEDVTVAVYQEAAARPLPRPFVIAAGRLNLPSTGPRVAGGLRGGLHVHDSRVHPLGDVREVHDAGRGGSPERFGQFRRCRRPLAGGGHHGTGRDSAGNDDAQQERHRGAQRNRQQREPAHLMTLPQV